MKILDKAIDKAKEYMDAWNEGGSTVDKSAALGTGMAKQAADTIQNRAYQLHIQESKALGEKPMSPEEFAKGKKS